MNPSMGRQWIYRWGKRAGLNSFRKILPGLPRCWFRGAPLITWLAGTVAHDLRKPDSRIRSFVRRLLENRRIAQGIRSVIVEPTEVHQNKRNSDDLIEGKTIRVLEKKENEKDR